jgi:hypothetical protein
MKIIKKDDKEIYVVGLNEASKAKFCGHTIQTEVVIIGKNLTPYIIPEKIALNCKAVNAEKTPKCAACPLFSEGHQVKMLMDEKEFLLELFDCPTFTQREAIRRRYGMVKCAESSFKPDGKINIEYVICVPQIFIAADKVTAEGRYVTMGMYYQGHGLETNKAYLITGVVVAHPRTQSATIIIKEAEELQGGLGKFKMTPELCRELKIFQEGE